jgi:hypothetical protein
MINDLKSECVEIELQEEFDDLEKDWIYLNNAIKNRKEKLDRSSEVQTFLNECAEATSFMNNRNEMLLNAIIPVSVAQSEQALRNHDRSFQEIKAFQNRIDHLTERSGVLNETICVEEKTKVQTMWKEIIESFQDFEKKLKEELRLQRFDDNATTYLKWGNGMIEQMDASDEPTNEHQANNFYDIHQQRKGGIKFFSKFENYIFLIFTSKIDGHSQESTQLCTLQGEPYIAEKKLRNFAIFSSKEPISPKLRGRLGFSLQTS